VASAAPPAAALPETEYDLNIHDGEVTTVFRVRDSGIRLTGDRIEWRIDGQPQNAVLADIQAIRLTTEVETARGPIGATSCQIRFRGGGAVTVLGGNSLSSDAAARRARYEAFVADLHRRLGPGERSRIRFIAGFGGGRFGILLVASVISALFLVLAPLALLAGAAKPRIGLAIAMAFGAVMTVGLFRLLQLNAPHIYDPADPLGSATAGSIGETFGHAIDEIRRGMTFGKGITAAAIALAAIAVVVLIVASRQTVSLFEPARARQAFDAVLARMGSTPTVIYVAVTPDELLIETPPGRDSSARTDWRASRRTLFGRSEWDDVSAPTDRYPMSFSDELGEERFKLDRDATAHLDDLASGAIERAALGPGARVTQMTLTAPHSFIKPEPPRWTVKVEGSGGHAELYAGRTGTLFPPTPAPAGPPRILIDARTASWLRVISPSQAVVFDGTLAPGQSYSVPNVSGLVLRTGHASSLIIRVDGHAVPAIDGDRHDIALDPQALLAGAAVRD
jgi:hypothetical protein